jgi:hypothetical protein
MIGISKPILIALRPDQPAALTKVARIKGLSRAALIRLIVADFLKAEAKKARAEGGAA